MGHLDRMICIALIALVGSAAGCRPEFEDIGSLVKVSYVGQNLEKIQLAAVTFGHGLNNLLTGRVASGNGLNKKVACVYPVLFG